MICGDSCLTVFVCCEKDIFEDKITGQNKTGREIVLDRQNIKIEHFHLEKLKNIECLSTSDGGSESDSGVGSVRTSKTASGAPKSIKSINQSETEKHLTGLKLAPKSPEPQFIDRDSTICTVTRADSMATLDQDCHSLDAFDDDDLLSIFNLGAESLTELMMAEFSKMATIDAQELAQEFAKQDRQVIPLSDQQHVRRAALKRGGSAVTVLSKQLSLRSDRIMAPSNQADSTPDVPSTPEIDLKNREKKMRKKRRMTRKTNFDADELETDSTSDSSRETPPNGRKTFPKKQ